jgi:predicted dehydrogenase
MVGSAFMAREHSAAYRLLPLVLGDVLPPIEMVRSAGGRRVHEVGPRYGWRETADEWRAVTEADDIDVVDVVTPNDTHALTISAVERGKHVVCEKPLARDAAGAEAEAEAQRRRGGRGARCGLLRLPVLARGRAGPRADRRGADRARAWLPRALPARPPRGPRRAGVWAFDPAKAGSGVIGDIAEVLTTSRTVLPAGPTPIDDEADLLLRFAKGATSHIWVSWLANRCGRRERTRSPNAWPGRSAANSSTVS